MQLAGWLRVGLGEGCSHTAFDWTKICEVKLKQQNRPKTVQT